VHACTCLKRHGGRLHRTSDQKLQEGDSVGTPVRRDITHTGIADHYGLVRDVIEVEAHGEVG
jgi:hypothetical protein